MPSRKFSAARPSSILGLNSGTSIDSLDWAIVECQGTRPRVVVKVSGGVPFPGRLRSELKKAAAAKTVDKEWLTRLDFDYGRWLGAIARRLCLKNRSLGSIDLVASHGQTVGHWPARVHPATLQIGDPDQIAKTCGVPVVSHFRHGDIAAGGEGAPLTPAVNQLLFAHATKSVAILNLGGIANISLLPPRRSARAPIGTDCGPTNMLLDLAARHMLKKSYDRNGAVAAGGEIHARMLSFMQRHPWFRRALPASCGREEFGDAYFAELMHKFPRVSTPDFLATLCAFSAWCVERAVVRLHAHPHTLYLTGGGVHNQVLVHALERALVPVRVKSVADIGFKPDALEAVSFAILAYLCARRVPLDLRNATGSKRPVILGRVTWP
jgi:anhydro-N-acetylmuramic acid kinase